MLRRMSQVSRLTLCCFALVVTLVFGPNLFADTVLDKLSKFAQDPAKNVVDDFKKAGSDLIHQGEVVGNGMIVHSGMELEALSRSAEIGLGADLNKTVGTLTQDEQEIILSLADLEATVKGVEDTAYSLKDTTVLDLTSWESHWIFAHTPDFFVQSVRGTGFVPQPGDYRLTLAAYGLGVAEDSKAEITGTLNGKPVTFSSIDQTSQRGVAVLAIPNSMLQPLFSPGALKLATLNLDVAVSRKKFTGWKTNHYSFPITLLLYPTQVAEVKVTMTAPTFGWTYIGDTFSPTVVTPDKNPCPYGNEGCRAHNTTNVTVNPAHVPPLAGDERLVAPPKADCIAKEVYPACALQCLSGSICTFEVWSETKITLNADQSRAQIDWQTYTSPASYVFHMMTEQWRQIGSATTAQTVEAQIDQPQVVTLPDQVSLIAVDVTAFTKQKYRLVLPSNDPHSIIAAAQQPGTSNLVITAVPPAI